MHIFTTEDETTVLSPHHIPEKAKEELNLSSLYNFPLMQRKM
jgi:hypothetical protein